MNIGRMNLLREIIAELKSAKKKNPQWYQHPSSQAGMVTKEVGELMKTCMQWKYERPVTPEAQKELFDNMRRAALATCAQAIRFLENLKLESDLPRVPETKSEISAE